MIVWRPLRERRRQDRQIFVARKADGLPYHGRRGEVHFHRAGNDMGGGQDRGRPDDDSRSVGQEGPTTRDQHWNGATIEFGEDDPLGGDRNRREQGTNKPKKRKAQQWHSRQITPRSPDGYHCP